MRLTVDTDVVVAAMRSPTGASAALVSLLLRGRADWLLSVAMALEYESICMLADHRLAAGASEQDVQNLLASIFDIIVPVEVHYQWRPQLSDASDEMVLETAVNGRAEAIVSFNHADYRDAPRRFGIRLWKPAEALKEIRK
ncbi:MAG: putative toxin-antitoxin system toxin component, PIN family [Bryobacteraceae bacterium]|nr:putative toxin-antitoxin system toxin component, PIN family [Bryobacteraceae bacterium]